MGFSGSGTVLAPYLGAKAALRALNDSSGGTAYSKTKLRTSLIHFFDKPYFLNIYDLYYRYIIDPIQFRQKKYMNLPNKKKCNHRKKMILFTW